MIDLDELMRRNVKFAASGSFEGLTIRATGNLRVIGCVDSRVDPSHVLGLGLGEATVIRNVGGRVAPSTIRTLEMLAKVSKANSGGLPPGDSHVVVLHHTECGIVQLSDYPEMLAQYFEVATTDLNAKAVSDPYESVRVDVDAIKKFLAPEVFVTGLVYDVTSGLVQVVVPPSRED
jgi:carbonic anhydrase